jgi:hypothetical protein
MQIANLIGNYTMAEADILRKSMSKKIVEAMDRERPKFLVGAKNNRVSEAKALEIWKQMEDFAKYGFNKSHSTAYGIVSFQTAYLKAHYPAEFMAALLSCEKDNRDKIIKHINGCRERGIRILPRILMNHLVISTYWVTMSVSVWRPSSTSGQGPWRPSSKPASQGGPMPLSTISASGWICEESTNV